VAARLARNATVMAWLPVAVLPPLLILDALLSRRGPDVTVLGVLAAYAGCLPLVWRRRLPFPVLAPLITAGILLVLFAIEPGSTVVAIPMVALYEVAASGTRRGTLLAAAVVVPCVAVSVAPFADDGGGYVGLLARNLALCLLALAVGDVVRSRREVVDGLLAAREEEALRRIGDERLRIAREVHDVVAHAMVAINVQAGVAAHLIDRDPEQARSALRDIKAASGEALTDLRATLGVLRGEDGAAPVTPATRLRDVPELATGLRAAGVDVDLEVCEDAGVPAAVEAASYRIVQEALTNVLRHAQASRVQVTVSAEDGGVRVEVVDDGTGGRRRGAPGGSGNGVRGMRERAEAIGGTLESGPAPEGGWRVLARIPSGTGAA